MDEAKPITIAGIEVPPEQRTPLVEALLRVIAQQQAEIERLRALVVDAADALSSKGLWEEAGRVRLALQGR